MLVVILDLVCLFYKYGRKFHWTLLVMMELATIVDFLKRAQLFRND